MSILLSNHVLYGDETIKNLNKKDITIKKGDITKNYRILTYNKTDMSFADYSDKIGDYRSVIVNMDNLQVVCVAPRKSIYRYPLLDNKYRFEEFLDGTMINLFYDGKNWEIATRNIIGANTKFYQDATKTFNIMFFESLALCNVDLNNINKQFVYSFVMQHPENRIVTPFLKPQLYLVETYEIIPGQDTTEIKGYTMSSPSCNTFVDELKKQFNETGILYPKTYNLTFDECKQQYASNHTSFTIPGFIVKNEENVFERYKQRNPIYENVRLLRGNQPKSLYLYLHNRKQKSLSNYIKYYPEEVPKIKQYEKMVNTMIRNIYEDYVSCFITKQKKIPDCPYNLRPHIYSLHEKYLTHYVGKPKQYIKMSDVTDYFNELPEQRQMYTLNYDVRIRPSIASPPLHDVEGGIMI
jgi:hypothetical protein